MTPRFTYLSDYLEGRITPFKTIGLGPTWYVCYTLNNKFDELSNHPFNHIISLDRLRGSIVVLGSIKPLSTHTAISDHEIRV